VALPRLDGKVAVVTGAGRGLGRSHALLLADLGAAVLVNDIGAGLDGSGRDDSPAAEVVATIRARGGRAEADGTDVGSITGGRAVVERAVEVFGRIDIVVNNAGFASGGGTIAAPVEAELDALLAVHLKAAVGTMAAAFAHFSAQESGGRIVNTVSEASLDARFVASLGYAAAKASLWGATLAAAAEGAAHAITVNAISPGARTRMNADLLDQGFREGASAQLDLDPRHVSAVVAYLASDAAADITGRVLHAAGGQVREYTTARTSRSDLAERIAAVLAGA
jgi:NAD(P)-dependent dehydrogenase (short-subunit alcohol dehydrogenase family)